MKNRILRSALSVALCAAMLLSQGLTAFADGEIVSRALETSPEYIQETETRIPNGECNKTFNIQAGTISWPDGEKGDYSIPSPIKLPCTEEKGHSGEHTMLYSQLAQSLEIPEGYEDSWELHSKNNDNSNDVVVAQGNIPVPENGTFEWGEEGHASTAFIDITFTKIPGGEDPENPEIPEIGEDILSKIYVDIICSTDDSHSFDNFVAKDHYQNLSQVSGKMYIITPNGSSATIKLKNLEKWLENYESSCLSGTYDGTHTIVDCTESIQLDCKDGKWSISGEDTFTIQISCSPDTPEIPSVEDLFSNIFVNIECTTDPQHSHFHYTNLSSIANGKEEEQIYYIINQYGKDAMIALANLDEWIASYVKNYYPDINHISVDEKPDSIALVYDEKTKEWNGIRDLVIKIACDTEEEKPAPPTDKWIGDHLKAIVDCVNEEAKHDLITLILSGIYGEDYWQISDVEWDESRGHYTVEVSIPNIEKYVTAYETQYGEHTFMKGYSDTVTTLHLIYDTESNGWSCLEDENGNPLDSFFLFVECKTPTPPEEENPESEDSEPPKGHTVTRHDDDDDWEPLPNNNYTIKKKQETKPLQQETIVVPEVTNNTVKVNPETGDTTTAFAAMALAAVSLGGVVLLGRKKK